MTAVIRVAAVILTGGLFGGCGPNAPSAVDVSGTWDATFEGIVQGAGTTQTSTITMELSQSGTTVSGVPSFFAGVRRHRHDHHRGPHRWESADVLGNDVAGAGVRGSGGRRRDRRPIGDPARGFPDAVDVRRDGGRPEHGHETTLSDSAHEWRVANR